LKKSRIFPCVGVKIPFASLTMTSTAPKFPLVENVDFSLMGHSEPKKSHGGAGIPIVYSSRTKTDRSSLVFQLNKPDPVLMDDNTSARVRDEALSKLPFIRTNFHLQSDPKYEVRDGKHTVLIAVPAHLAAEVRRLDEANIAEVVANSKEWFKRNLSPELIRENYGKIVQLYPNNPEVAEADKCECLRVKVIQGKTEIFVQNSNRLKSFHQGDINDLRRNARVVCVFQDNGIYFRSTESGGQLFAKRILVMHGDAEIRDMQMDMDVDIEIEENFDPQYAPAAPAPAALHDPSITDQTVVGGVTHGKATEYQGPAVVF
jgi:hypothetical protein